MVMNRTKLLKHLAKIRKLKRNKKKYHQTGTRKSIKQEGFLLLLDLGYRISKSGKKYYEARKNRSDVPPGKL